MTMSKTSDVRNRKRLQGSSAIVFSGLGKVPSFQFETAAHGNSFVCGLTTNIEKITRAPLAEPLAVQASQSSAGR